MKKLIFCAFISLIHSFQIGSTNKSINSILSEIIVQKFDTSKINMYFSIGDSILLELPDSSLYFYNKALQISNTYLTNHKEKGLLYTKMLHFKAFAIRNIASALDVKGNFNQSINLCNQSLEIFEELNDKRNIGCTIQNIGYVYDELGNYDLSLFNYMKALKIFEQLNYKKGIAVCLTDIGVINGYQNNFALALSYNIQALKIKNEIGDKYGIANCYGNIGELYASLKKYNVALDYYSKSLRIRQELGDKEGMAICNNNIGDLQLHNGYSKQALTLYLKALKLYGQISNKEGISICYYKIADTYNKIMEYNIALEYGKKSLSFAKEILTLPRERDANEILSISYEALKDYKLALYHHHQFKILNDSIFNVEKQNQLTKMEAIYQGDKKQKEIEILEKDKKLKNAELRKVQIQKFGLAIGIFLMIVLALVILRSYHQKQIANTLLTQQKLLVEEANEELNQQNEEIAAQRDEIEMQRNKLFTQRKDIIDSIEYAKYIQQALLKSHEVLNQCELEHFIFFKPRDIISGDFYWFKQIKNYLYFTAADCTGHGVPGAFMSVLGISLINEIITKRDLNPPNIVLNELRKKLKKSLNQDDPTSASQDGMDIALCLLDLETKKLQFAGAFNPLFIVRNNEINEYKADHMPIGVHPKDKMEFTIHEIQLEENDLLYVFSDGYISQFGGEIGKKFNYNRFKQLLIDINNYPLETQKQMLNQTIIDWQNDFEQIDDILVIGIRI